MFGYVSINKPELKIKDYDRYRMYYCGVCRSIRERYKTIGQLSLTYDAAFAAVLLSALYEPHTSDDECRCMLHPLHKRCFLSNAAIEYMADMNVLLSYYKCLDDWKDDRNFIKLTYSGAIRKNVKKTALRYKNKIHVICEKLDKLAAYEAEDNHNIDLLSGCFGDIMRVILSVSPDDLNAYNDKAIYKEDWSEELGDFGFYLGKFIYILDAYDDVADDERNNKFNPFLDKYRKMDYDEFRTYVKQILLLVAADMAKAYEKLPIVDEIDILRNVIYSGIWLKFYEDSNSDGKERTV